MTIQSVTFRMSSAKVETLDKLAAATERDRTYHINKAVDAYLAKKTPSSNGKPPAPAAAKEKKPVVGVR
jgi:predicted transcriptional regulator